MKKYLILCFMVGCSSTISQKEPITQGHIPYVATVPLRDFAWLKGHPVHEDRSYEYAHSEGIPRKGAIQVACGSSCQFVQMEMDRKPGDCWCIPEICVVSDDGK